MKAYFTKLFQYDRHANLLILETIKSADNPEKPVQLLAHLLGSQQVWLKRCRKDPGNYGPIWPDWKAEQLDEIIEQNHKDWIAFINSLSDEDFESKLTYQNSKGDTFTDDLTDILAHVINHGTHHRAQAGQQLKFAGVDKLPITDYIFYIRGQSK